MIFLNHMTIYLQKGLLLWNMNVSHYSQNSAVKASLIKFTFYFSNTKNNTVT
jgi:hypothetical protein